MSGYIVRAGKRNVAFGLVWSSLPGVEKTRTEIKALAEDHDGKEYVVLPAADNRPLLGLLKKDSKVAKGASRGGAYAAAAALATAYKDVISHAMFGVLLPGKQAALMGFRDGVPIVGFDRVVPLSGVSNVVSDYLKALGAEEAMHAEFFGHEEVFPGRESNPFGLDWFSTVESAKIKGTQVRAVKKPVRLIVTAMVLLAGGVFGLSAYDDYQKEQAKKVRIVAVDPNQAYEKSVSALLSAAGYPGVEVAWQMIEALNRLPLYHKGWRLIEAECTPGSCILSWSNEDGGTYQSFASEALPGLNVKRTEYMEGLTALKTTVDYQVTGKQGVNPQFLPVESDYIMSFGSRAQNLKDAGVTTNFAKGTVIGIPPVPAGQPPITENVLKAPIKEGDWTLSGAWMYSEALRNLPLNMTINKLNLNIKDELISMSVTGKYYVKK